MNPANSIPECVLLAHGPSSSWWAPLVYCNCRSHTEKEKHPVSLCWVSSHWPVCSRKTYFWGQKPAFPSQHANAREISTEQETIHFQTESSLLAPFEFISQVPLPPPMLSWHCFAEIRMQGPSARWLLQARVLSASQEVLSAAPIFHSCQVQGAERCLSPNTPVTMSK